MNGPDIARRLAKDSKNLALASRADARCLFVVPIAEVLAGLSVDRTSRASKNVLKPFAFPLAFGETGVVLDSRFGWRKTSFNPQDKDSAKRAQMLMEKHVVPWLRVRGTLAGLFANTAPPERGDEYDKRNYVYRPAESINHAKLLCLAGRIREARNFIGEVEADFEKFGPDDTLDRSEFKQLLALRTAVVDGDKDTRAEFWSNARKSTLRALQINADYLETP